MKPACAARSVAAADEVADVGAACVGCAPGAATVGFAAGAVVGGLAGVGAWHAASGYTNLVRPLHTIETHAEDAVSSANPTMAALGVFG